jgi:undecaprenyl-diphosphatase
LAGFPKRIYIDPMEYLQILILALIQGAAELLPVSSSAHVILAAKLMDRDPSRADFVFLLMMLHTGTMFAVLVYFWPRWRRLLFSSPEAGGSSFWQFAKMVVLATACTGVLGLGLKLLIEKAVFAGIMGHKKGEVEYLFKDLRLIAGALFAVGIVIIAAGFHESKSVATTVSPSSAIWIGIIQGLCLPFRGFSRSGATISTALFRGIARPLAEDFSFALAVVITPPLLVYEFNKLRHEAVDAPTLVREHLTPALVGMVFSFLAGLVALRFLSAVLERGRWRYFGYYCLVAAAVVLGFAVAGR